MPDNDQIAIQSASYPIPAGGFADVALMEFFAITSTGPIGGSLKFSPVTGASVSPARLMPRTLYKGPIVNGVRQRLGDIRITNTGNFDRTIEITTSNAEFELSHVDGAAGPPRQDDQGGAVLGNCVAPTQSYVDVFAITAAATLISFVITNPPATPSKVIRVRRVWVVNPGTAPAAGRLTFDVQRITSHGGGAVVTPNRHQPAAANASLCEVRTGATPVVSSSLNIVSSVWVPIADGEFMTRDLYKWDTGLVAGVESASTTGIAIRALSGLAGHAGLRLGVEWTED